MSVAPILNIPSKRTSLNPPFLIGSFICLYFLSSHLLRDELGMATLYLGTGIAMGLAKHYSDQISLSHLAYFTTVICAVIFMGLFKSGGTVPGSIYFFCIVPMMLCHTSGNTLTGLKSSGLFLAIIWGGYGIASSQGITLQAYGISDLHAFSLFFLFALALAIGSIYIRSRWEEKEREGRTARTLEFRSVIQQLSQEIFGAQERERASIARDLHDETGQLLTALRTYSNLLQGHTMSDKGTVIVGEIDNLVGQLFNTTHSVLDQLRCTNVEQLGVLGAIKTLTQYWQQSTGCQIDLLSEGCFEELPFELETALYRIVQESLNNIEKHADASKVKVALLRGTTTIALHIEDNGCGFSLATKNKNPTGFGLIGMRERVELLGGEFICRNRTDHNTRHRPSHRGVQINVKLPLSFESSLLPSSLPPLRHSTSN